MSLHRGACALVACAALLLSGCVPGPPEPVPPPTPPPTPSPTDAVVVGQGGLPGLEVRRDVLDVSVAELELALDAEGEMVLAPQSASCGLASLEDAGVAAVTDDDQAVLAYVLERDDVRTAEGVAVGSSVDEVLRTYGDLAVVLDTVSVAGGPVVVVRDLEQPDRPPEGTLTYGFDTDADGRVARVRAGLWPWTAHAAYCDDGAPRAGATGWPLG